MPIVKLRDPQGDTDKELARVTNLMLRPKRPLTDEGARDLLQRTLRLASTKKGVNVSGKTLALLGRVRNEIIGSPQDLPAMLVFPGEGKKAAAVLGALIARAVRDRGSKSVQDAVSAALSKAFAAYEKAGAPVWGSVNVDLRALRVRVDDPLAQALDRALDGL